MIIVVELSDKAGQLCTSNSKENRLKLFIKLKRTIIKGNKKLLTVLNSLLADELTAINQYMVHSEMCENSTKFINTSIVINK